jgi:hypothetical protein
MRKHTTLCLSFALLIGSLPALAQEPAADINAQIRKEAADHSQIMHTMHFLADVYGPRLTGSPNHKAAAEWAAKQLTAWGLQNAHLEAWDFGHPGWLNERLTKSVTTRTTRMPASFRASNRHRRRISKAP